MTQLPPYPDRPEYRPSPANPPDHTTPDLPAGHADHQKTGGFGGHKLMMLACCVPMVAIVGVLFFTGVVGSGFILFAVVCVAMMAMMMMFMPGHRH